MMPARPPQSGEAGPNNNNNNNNNSPSATTTRSFTAFLVPPPMTFFVQLGNGVQLEITPSPERLLSSLLGAGTGVPIVFTTSMGDGSASMDNDAMLRAVHELFARSQSEPHGPPPTSKAFLDALPRKTWNAATCADEKYTDCAICLSEYETNDDVLSLPCGHAFHRDCGLPWLVEHNVCPTCRYEMPTQQQQADKPPAASSNDSSSATASATAGAAVASATTAEVASASRTDTNATSNSATSSTTDRPAADEHSEPEEEPAFERMLRTLLGVRRERSPTITEAQPARPVRQRVDPVDASITLPGAVPSSSSPAMDANSMGSSSSTINSAVSSNDESDGALDSLLEEEATRFVAEETAKLTAGGAVTSAIAIASASSSRDASDAAIFDDVDLDELLHDTRPLADNGASA